MKFTEAEKEILPIAKELFEKNKEKLGLTVEPKDIYFLRSDSKKKAFAYVKKVTDEYTLLTEKKFFLVIVSKYFDLLKTDAEKKYVILHEMMHLLVDEFGKYKMIDHNLKEFRELLQNPEWNLLLVDDGKNNVTTSDGEVRIGLDFDFHNKQALKDLKEKLKEKDPEEVKPDEFGAPQEQDERPDLE